MSDIQIEFPAWFIVGLALVLALPVTTVLMAGLGIAWRRRDSLDKAIRELRKAVVEDTDDLDARAALGEEIGRAHV